MPNNAIRSLFVDSSNILWIGTENGVVKNENGELKYLFEEDGLALNSCWAIAEDKNGLLWFGSYGGGVSIYDGFRFKVISEKDGLVHNEITKLFYSDGYMYVGTSDGISIIDINNFEVYSPKLPPEEDLMRVVGFFEANDEVYMVTYKTGIYKIQLRKKPALVKMKDHKFIYSVFKDQDSIYSSNKGFFIKTQVAEYVSEKDTVAGKRMGTSIIWDYKKTNDDKIFTAAWGIYDRDGGIYELVDKKLISKADEFNVSSKEVISLAYDERFERLYVGTKDAGLFEISLDPMVKFHETGRGNVIGFANTERTSAVLFSSGIQFKKASEEMFISLAQLKTWQENFVSITNKPLPQHRDDFYELDYLIRAKDVKFYDIKMSGANFWVNTNIGVFEIGETGELQRYLPLHTEEINFTTAGDLIETNPYGGVRIYEDLENFSYRHFDQKYPHTPTMVVSSLQRDQKTYFLSIFSGLYVQENNEFRSYLEDGIWEEKKLKHITTLGKDLAISNEFGDVFIVNDEADFRLLKKIPRAQIQGNSISFLKENKGFLIIGTEKGLTLYRNNRFIFIDGEQGLKPPLLSARVEKDILYLGSENGFYVLDLSAIAETSALVDQLKLKEILINNQLSLEAKEEVKLSYDQNTVLLKFTTNAHPYPNKLKYRYRLNKNEPWSLAASQPQIFLASLPAGKYNIDVKVSDESTGLDYTRSLLQLTLRPPFWKTWWFLLLTGIILLLVIFSVYRFQISQHQKFENQKSLIQRRFEETKMEALLAQMNPHFIFNAMNSIQYYILDNDIDKASCFLRDFSKLIRLNLDHCTEPKIQLSEEIEYLQSYIRVENTRFNNAINVTFGVDPKIDTYEVEIPPMLLQTFVENVFVHAFPTGSKVPTLKICFKLFNEHVLQCRIEDNGIGFTGTASKKLHESKGIKLVKERLALLGYNVEEALEVNSSRNKGTCVSLKLQV